MNTREIKFRYWDEDNNEMTDSFEIGSRLSEVCCNNNHIMQYTGLKDKNDKDIYEGDIVKGHEPSDVVSFESGCFWFGEAATIDLKSDRYEIIGNIHENPELLEK